MKYTGFITNAYIENNEGKILMVKLKKIGKWGLPGGKVEPGELPRQALKREFVEELGVEVEIKRLVGFREYYWESDGHFWVDLVYKANIIGNTIPENKEPDKITAFEYRDKQDLPKGTKFAF